MVSLGGGGGGQSSSSSSSQTPAAFTSLAPLQAAALTSLLFTGGPQYGQPTTAIPQEFLSTDLLPGTKIHPSGTPIDELINQLFGTGATGGAAGGAPVAGAGTGAPLVAPIQANEQALLDQLMASTQLSPEQTASRELLGRTIGGEFLTPDSNPFIAALIQNEQNRLATNFRNVEAPLLQSRFTRAGQEIQPQGSSAFDTAAAIALSGLAQGQADIATRIGASTYEAERGRQVQAQQLAEQVSSADAEKLINVLQAQALPRLIEQHGIDAGLEEFRRRMDVILQALGLGTQSAAQQTSKSNASAVENPSWNFGLGFSSGE